MSDNLTPDPNEPAAAGRERRAPADEPNWERAALERIALAAVNEQRAARRWRIFFRFLFLGVGRARFQRRESCGHDGAAYGTRDT